MFPVCLSGTLVYCGRTVGWIKTPLGVEVGRGPGDIVLDGDPASPKRGHTTQFSTHVRYGQTDGWIEMPLGMDEDLCPGDFWYYGQTAGCIRLPLNGDPVPPTKKGTQPPVFGPCLLWPNGWMRQDTT